MEVSPTKLSAPLLGASERGLRRRGVGEGSRLPGGPRQGSVCRNAHVATENSPGMARGSLWADKTFSVGKAVCLQVHTHTCACMCPCVRVHLYTVYTCAYVFLCAPVHAGVCLHVCGYCTCLRLCMCRYMHVDVCTCLCMSACLCVCICVDVRETMKCEGAQVCSTFY